jgi:zinc protease
MKILVEENHDLPLVRVQLGFPSGAADDPSEIDGLCNFSSELLGRGAAGRSRADLDRAFDALGGSLDIITDLDGVYFELTVLRDKLDAALGLISDVLLRPDWPVLEAEKLVREIDGQLDEMRDDDGQLARRFFGRTLYGEHPYGRTILGSKQTVAKFDVAAAKAWHERVVRTGSLVFGLAGDVNRAETEALAQKYLGAMPAGGGPGIVYPPTARRQGLRVTLVDKPERTQSQILWGQPAAKWGTPEFFALQVATCAYGGTFTARLMNEVRSKRGFSYGASARVGQGRGTKALVAHIFPSLEQTAEALKLVLDLHADWVTRGITDEELNFAKQYLSRSFAFTISTPEDRLELAMSLALAGMPADHGDKFTARINAVTLEDTRRAMAAYLTPGDLEIVIVCTADELQPKLEASGIAFSAIEVVPYDSY